MDHMIQSIVPDGMDLKGYADFVGEFVASFEEVCYALGGNELISQVRTEVEFDTRRGADMVESLTKQYERIRGDIQ